MPEIIRVNVTLTAEVHEQLRVLAFEQRTTIPEVIRQAVEASLKKAKKGGAKP